MSANHKGLNSANDARGMGQDNSKFEAATISSIGHTIEYDMTRGFISSQAGTKWRRGFFYFEEKVV